MLKITRLLMTLCIFTVLALTPVIGMAASAPGELTVTLKFDTVSGGLVIENANLVILKSTDGVNFYIDEIAGAGVTDSIGEYTWYGLDTTCDYKVIVQDTDDFDKAEIIISAADIAIGANELIEVTKVVRPDYLTVVVSDGTGAPVPDGTKITLGWYDVEFYQPMEVDKFSEAGVVKFRDATLEAISDIIVIKYEVLSSTNQVTTFMQAIELTTNSSNEITQSTVYIDNYATVEISGTVTNLDGNPIANQRVFSGEVGNFIYKNVSSATGQWRGISTYEVMGFDTYTDSNGKYTLMIPYDPGTPSDICLIDRHTYGSYANKLYDEAMAFAAMQEIKYPDGSWGNGQSHKELIHQTVFGMPSSNRDLALIDNYILKAKFLNAVTNKPITDTSHTGQAHVEFLNVGASGGHTHYDDMRLTLNSGANMELTTNAYPSTYDIIVNHGFDYDRVYGINITLSDIISAPANGSGVKIVDLGTIYVTPLTPVPPYTVINCWHPSDPCPYTIPARGWVQTRLEKVEDFSTGVPNTYEVTLHYMGQHNMNSVVTNVEIEIPIPDGVTVTLPVGSGLTYNPPVPAVSEATLTKSISSIPIKTPYEEKFLITVDPSSAANYYSISSSVSIDDSSMDFTSMMEVQRLRINLLGPRMAKNDQVNGVRVFGDITGAGENGVSIVNSITNSLVASTYKAGRWYYSDVIGLPLGINSIKAKTEREGVPEESAPLHIEIGDHLPYVEDSYIVSSEGFTIPANPKRGIPSYTAFVDINKEARDFEVFTKIANTTAGDTVNFTVLGKSYPATPVTVGTDNYWTATISGLQGYGDCEIMVDINGKDTLAGSLLLLFGY